MLYGATQESVLHLSGEVVVWFTITPRPVMHAPDATDGAINRPGVGSGYLRGTFGLRSPGAGPEIVAARARRPPMARRLLITAAGHTTLSGRQNYYCQSCCTLQNPWYTYLVHAALFNT